MKKGLSLAASMYIIVGSESSHSLVCKTVDVGSYDGVTQEYKWSRLSVVRTLVIHPISILESLYSAEYKDSSILNSSYINILSWLF